MSCCGASADYDGDRRGLAPGLGQARGVSRDPARQRFCGRPAGRPGRRVADGGRLCRESPDLLRSAFKHLFSARKSDWDAFDGIFDAFWLGKRCAIALDHHGIGEGGQQSVAEKPAGQRRRTTPASETRDGPGAVGDDAPEDRAGEGRMEGASRADNLAEVDFRKIGRSGADRARPTPPRRDWPRSCARG